MLQIRNVTTTLQRVRILPASSQYFHVSRLALPTSEGVIAPGVHAEAKVKFTPDSLANFTDVMQVVTKQGTIAVPLIARRVMPVLEMESHISLGPVHVGNMICRQVTVRAQQGEGAFRIISSREFHSCGGVLPTQHVDRVELPGGFTISPAEFSLATGDTVTIHFSFSPVSRGTPNLKSD